LKELKTYPEGTPFTGTIGRTASTSEAAWPLPKRARDGAPNVLTFLLDDVGFAQLGCFGSDIRTPTFDRLAAAPPLSRLPHHGDLLADARVPDDRTQSSQQRRGHHPGDVDRLPRLQRLSAARERLPFGDPAR